MKNLLFEVGTEELPARFIEPAIKEIKEIAEKLFQDLQLNYDEIISAGTCKRLVLFVKNLQEKQEDKEEEILGPSYQVAYDKEGNPTSALLGFIRKYNLSLEQLFIRETSRGRYICAKRIIIGKATKELLPELLLKILQSISFPKSMRWGNYEFYFARPIRWILALYDEEIIPLKIAGVESNNFTFGHRFLAPQKLIIPKSDWNYYKELLYKNYVIVDLKERISETEKRIYEVASPYGHPEIEPELLKENANLVEFPFPLVGAYSEQFLTLPPPLVSTALQEHQRYFIIKDSQGKLLPYFVAVNNNKPKDEAIVKEGHERVAKARLEDALFYYQRDLKEPLKNFVERLKGITYHVKCGTLYDKTQRLIKLGHKLRDILFPDLSQENVEKSCFYAKADLATEVVKEFPSLQGYMGSHYLILEGEKEIAPSIYEQYLPSPKEERYPETPYGIILSLADKIDHLCALIGSGEKITGEGDPYALRRAGYGIIKILLERELSLRLEEIFAYGLSLLEEAKFLRNKRALEEILDFMKKRLEGEFLALGFSKNFIYVILDQPLDPYIMYQKLLALREIYETKDFKELSILFKRVTQILKNIDTLALPEINQELFEFSEERNLFEELQKKTDILQNLYKHKEFKLYLENLLTFKPLIDSFFDKVFVMVEREDIQKNRLSLLSKLTFYFNLYGDFTHLA
ncbi:MAG: glycine--tRNA ligase subunit beta [Caldimicrobium sp.]|nr:glycine--tRNA ligase subunit beta [Caldimicrobium sp.]MCX7873525.1 glycine--tRNA ligase subunit beta [Caldimicrobium sp.]MDW8094696.1 glycine--tRNA ligase subunit beta [Caldimicrobium sp.]